jgi:hypothetical protein
MEIKEKSLENNCLKLTNNHQNYPKIVWFFHSFLIWISKNFKSSLEIVKLQILWVFYSFVIWAPKKVHLKLLNYKYCEFSKLIFKSQKIIDSINSYKFMDKISAHKKCVNFFFATIFQWRHATKFRRNSFREKRFASVDGHCRKFSKILPQLVSALPHSSFFGLLLFGSEKMLCIHEVWEIF